MRKQHACLIALALVVATAACRRSGESVESSQGVATSTTAVARGPSVGEWTTAKVARDWSFPRDHAAHDDHWMEWWYYTGNVKSKSGRRFGF
jgi:predicted secreted hydrolase